MKSINEIAREVLVEEGRSNIHKLQHYMQLGVRAVRELNIDVTGQLKTVILTPNSYRAIDVPEDYYDYSKIGVDIAGEIHVLGVNNNMMFPYQKNDVGQLQPTSYTSPNMSDAINANSISGLGLWFYNYVLIDQYGENTGRLYGSNGTPDVLGTYRYWAENRQFVFSPMAQNKQIVLEYISTGINNANVLVPDEAIESVISFIRWKGAKGNEREQFRVEWENNVRRLRLRQFSFTVDEFIRATRQAYHQAPKQ